MSAHRGWLPLLLSAAIAGVFLIDICDVVYDCGCRSLWNGAAEACNIHEPTGPHCPWCMHPFAGGAVAFGAVLMAQSSICFACARSGFWIRLTLAVAAFPVVSAIVGWLQGSLWDYWIR